MNCTVPLSRPSPLPPSPLPPGIRNFQARNHLQRMRLGDKIFFYASSCKSPGIQVGEVSQCRLFSQVGGLRAELGFTGVRFLRAELEELGFPLGPSHTRNTEIASRIFTRFPASPHPHRPSSVSHVRRIPTRMHGTLPASTLTQRARRRAPGGTGAAGGGGGL